MERRFSGGQMIAALAVVAGSAMGIAVAFAALTSGVDVGFQITGPLADWPLHFHLDALSAFFLVPIFLVGAAGSVYGLSYWNQEEHQRTGKRLRFCYGLLIAGLALVVLATDAIAFLFAWEIMALSAFFLVSTEEHKREAREAGWLYLVSTHIGTLFLFGLFALWRTASGSFDFHPLVSGQAGLGLRTLIFLVALIGFGLKAGMMPFHFWLPSAHANAPSHVSAMLSGVVLKVGIYGLLRTLTLLPIPPASWGGLVLILGTISAVLGVLFALGQHDLKRLLAYHSIENIGIILIGLGLALIGQSRRQPTWVVLGMAGCLLHVWNHSLFKSLLFLAAGSVIHSTHTREIDHMGGLGKSHPQTALLFLIGAVAICGLPPLNGFVSELFIYLGLFHGLQGASSITLAVPALGLVGALALACFVKAFGAVFLGMPRSKSIAHFHESPLTMILPMAVLAGCCLAIGLFPILVVQPLHSVIAPWTLGLPSTPALATLAPLTTLTPIGLLIAGIVVMMLLLNRRHPGWLEAKPAMTWDCGYALPNRRMQYTASSFAALLVGLFRGVLRPHAHAPKLVGPFPAASRYQSHVDDVVLDGFLHPIWHRFRSHLGWLRVLQQGSVQTYVTYILIALLALLLFTMPIRDILRFFVVE